MNQPPTRTVRILKDPKSAVWFMRCAEPCQPQGWCMTDEERHQPMCYLGGCLSEEGARLLANRRGYTVEPE